MRLREFAPAGGGGSGNYFRELASAWYNGVFDTGSLPKGIKTQEDVERLLNRGIVCPDGKTRKLHIDYNSDFDGVEIYSDDYYEYGDHDDTIDSRTGQKWGPYDFMAFSDEDLSEGLNEFAADDGDSGEEDALHKYARMWWAGDEATQMQIERALAKMGWEIGEDEGGYDTGGVFVVRAGDENGNSYQSWAAEDLTEGLTEVDRRGFLKGLGAAAVAGAAGGANASTTFSPEDLKIVEDYLNSYYLTQSGSGYYGKNDEQEFKQSFNNFIKKYGAEGKDLLNKRYKEISHRVKNLSNDQRTAHYSKYKQPNTAAFQQLLDQFNESVNQGVAEGLLDEKSTSQAQFRTMAAAAHDPKFARKVGIKQSVAREFNKADKGQSYKSLPKKA